MLVRAATEEAQRRLLVRGYGDVTPIDAVILAQLLRFGESRATELAKRMGYTKQAIQRPLRRIEAHGYLQRRTDPRDGRAQLLRLTDRGRAAALASLEVAREIDDGWEDMAEQEELSQCKALLLRLSTDVSIR